MNLLNIIYIKNIKNIIYKRYADAVINYNCIRIYK